MKKIIFLATALSLLVNSIAHAGLFALVELPQLKTIIQKSQADIAHAVETINDKKSTSYVFKPNAFEPHLSLAFIAQDPNLTAEDAKKRFPGLEEELLAIAQQHEAFAITDIVANSIIAYWPGAAELKLAGEASKKNYLNVIFKLETSIELKELAESITRILEEKYGIKQRFAFSAHITLGTIYEKNDGDVKALSSKLPGQGALPWTLEPIVITEFKLKGANGSEKIFRLR